MRIREDALQCAFDARTQAVARHGVEIAEIDDREITGSRTAAFQNPGRECCGRLVVEGIAAIATDRTRQRSNRRQRLERVPIGAQALLDVRRFVPLCIGNRRLLVGEKRTDRVRTDAHANDAAGSCGFAGDLRERIDGFARRVQDTGAVFGRRRIMFVASIVITGSPCWLKTSIHD